MWFTVCSLSMRSKSFATRTAEPEICFASDTRPLETVTTETCGGVRAYLKAWQPSLLAESR